MAAATLLWTLPWTLALMAALTPDPAGSDPWVSPVRELIDNAALVDQVIDLYIDSEKRRLADIRSKLTEHRARIERLKVPTDSSDGALEKGATDKAQMEGVPVKGGTDEYLAHPLNSFRVIRSWFDLRAACDNKNKLFEEEYYQLMRKKIRIPNRQTTVFLLKNLLRAQILYNVSMEHFVTGNISGHATEHRLQAADMEEMAYLAQEFLHFVLSAQWLVQAVLHTDEADLATIDRLIDSLVSALRVLTNDGAIPSSARLLLERWIYVNNREASTRAGVLQDLRHVLDGAEIGPHLTVSDVQYKPCPMADPLGAVENKDIRVLDITLSDAQKQEMVNLVTHLWQASFHIEGLRSQVWPEVLDVEQTDYVNKTMESIASEAERLCPTCNIREALDTRSYSVQIVYDSGGYPGLDFVIETTQFKNWHEHRLSGIHVILFGSEADQGNVIPIRGGPAVIPEKGRGLMWRTEDALYRDQLPVFCPVLFGERTLLHVFIGTR